MDFNTETIDKLFLELSQFTNANTPKEIELLKVNSRLHLELMKAIGRLTALRKALGYIENGTSTSITIFQDDATKDYFINSNGKTILYNPNWSVLLDKLSEYYIHKEE